MVVLRPRSPVGVRAVPAKARARLLVGVILVMEVGMLVVAVIVARVAVLRLAVLLRWLLADVRRGPVCCAVVATV
jgi:hypothetical protein